MQYISELRERDRVSAIYLCKVKQSALTKAGKTYYSLTLQDRTGTISGKIWELGNGIDHFESMDYIQIDGDVTIYQGAPQLNIRRVRKAREGEYDPADFLPLSPFPVKGMYDQLLGYVSGIRNDRLRELAESIFVEDKEFVRKFQGHSAAKSVHHSFVGGLVQHTLRVTQLCDFYCQNYPILNRDLLILGALCHDIGKVKELAPFPENDYTDEGQLLGHIVIGYGMLKEKISKIPGFPTKTATELYHLILAHHGELEFGSPKKPALIEAVALHYADNTDAKLETMGELFEKAAPGEAWLGYQKLWESNVRKTTPLE